MSSNFLLSFFRALKLPAKLLVGFFRRKSRKGKSDLEKKQLAYVRNFSSKHYSWQKNSEKKKKITKRFKGKRTAKSK